MEVALQLPTTACVVKEPHNTTITCLRPQAGTEASGIGGQLQEVKLNGLKLSSPSTTWLDDNNTVASHTKEEEEDDLQSAQAEMGQVREENERLKKMLEQIEKDYKSLQLRFLHTMQQHSELSTSKKLITEAADHELVSLCLGRSSSTEAKKEGKTNNIMDSDNKSREKGATSLSLALGTKRKSSSTLDLLSVSNLSPENSTEEPNGEEEAGEAWPPSKVLKTMKGASDGDDHQVSSQSIKTVKRARVSVRARCDNPTLNDGCQWRKYGQKIAKGNPCPRAYYRCTVAQGCPVRKQVQRCADDMSILITTYEGTHSHPLPVSAAAMASTTSAAASMLLSGSSTSQPGITSTSISAAVPSNDLKNSSSPYDNGCLSTNPLFFFSHGQPNTTSSSAPSLFPTVTLDLTTTPSSSISNFNKISSSSTFASYPRAPSSTNNLNFSSSSESSTWLPTTLWGNGIQFQAAAAAAAAYGPHNQTQNGSFFNLRKNPHDHLYQPLMDKKQNQQAAAPVSQQALAETLTKAITSNPNFRSVLAAAISTMVGRDETNNQDQDYFAQNLMQTNNNPPGSSIVSPNGKACASSYFSSIISQTGSSSFRQPSLPFPMFKSSPPPADNNKVQNN